MSNDTQPEIRFPGFTDDWELRKSKELCTISTGKGNTQDKVDDGAYPFYVRSATIEKSDEYLYDQEAVLTVGDGVGTGKVYHYVNGKYNLHQRVYRMYDFKDVSAKYFYYYFSNNFYKRVMSMTAKTSVDSVRMEMIADMNIVFPSVKEQENIVELFSNLDNTIALHQRKLDLLKETKKGFLQKMFPKNGAKVPEIRFPGFTEDWEERRLQEVVDRYDNLRIPITASKRVAGNTPYYGANGIQGYVEGYTHDGEFILVAEDGANDLKNYPVQYVDGKVWVNNHAHVIQAKENLADNMFLMNAIRSINIEPFLVGGGRAKLNADVLMKLEVIIPLKSEQQKIGNFFKQLDDTITLHQRKLDLLKEMKKGFLQKMFV
ncbi:restriction endonuclease subunit S [Enterococcus faecium]|uniref:restriction endonuclease subunit S n=1 Tax=Enterococcus faecium TaxID=1352 RepID=UPI00100DEA39|nr:restriction endonuclease subunit S [Enterococcus faecium]RXW94270.1 restriction endonuclease subunit S [Enterococcus faecium]TKN44225.1 restriction endonuclease subunit S [Enterococcus faecium]TKN51791.1 restriction endonuclease subunit S [Enterococcus faecium]TKN59984.1 restriction endonuclease subunit S [Enterococcus faecium]TKO09041.1 restriction endonuclease subunit S [Enterococcus faecium]